MHTITFILKNKIDILKQRKIINNLCKKKFSIPGIEPRPSLGESQIGLTC